MNGKTCSQCESERQLENLYGFYFCRRCLKKLALHSDKTILKNADQFDQNKPISYEEEVTHRLQQMDKNYIKTKVKLMHILERLVELR